MNATDIFTIIMGFGAVIAGGVAAIYGGWQATIAQSAAEQAKAIYRDQMQPYVYANIQSAEHSKQLLVLYVKNSGPTVATNVTFGFNPPISLALSKGKPAISEWSLTSLPPGASLERSLGAGHEVVKVNSNSQIEVDITAEGYAGERFSLKYKLDFAALAPTNATGKTLNDIGESLNKIAKSLGDGNSRGVPIRDFPSEL